MDFELNDEQAAIRETARDLLAARDSRDGDVWPELCELGWPGIAAAERHGGLGLGLVELAVLVEELGFACASTPMLGTVLAATVLEAAGDEAQAERWVPGLASGSFPAALALVDPPSLIPDAAADRLVLVADRGADRIAAFAADGVSAATAIDPGRLHGRLRAADAGAEVLAGGAGVALDRALVVVAAELVGLCRRALQETLAYVKERRQFGVPVGSFQAVQHSAAQMLRDTEAAAAVTYFAAWAADAAPELLPIAAAQAKAQASEAGRAVTATAIQLHGGIGFTWEAPLHWLFKRAQVDAVYLGGGGHHRARVAALAAAAPAPAAASPVNQ